MRTLASVFAFSLCLVIGNTATVVHGDEGSACREGTASTGDDLQRHMRSALDQFFADILRNDVSFRFSDVRATDPDEAVPDPKKLALYTSEFERSRLMASAEWREHFEVTGTSVALCRLGRPSLFFVESKDDAPYYLEGQAIQWAIRVKVLFVAEQQQIEEVYDVVFKVSGVQRGNVDGVILRRTARLPRDL
jgi:hypothetical protein